MVVGAKGSGKTTLIKALFPGLEADFSEKKPYRLYELPGGLYVAEVCGSPDSLGSLLLSKPAWRLRAGLVLVDGASGVRADGRALALAAGAPLRAIVLTKADVSPPERIEEARALAARVGFEFFAVSATKNVGIDKLRGWLAGTVPVVQPTARPQGRHFRVDVIPIPLPGALDSRTHIVSFHIPRALLDALDQLVEMGVFNNRSEAIRTALFNLLREHRDLAERRQMILGYR